MEQHDHHVSRWLAKHDQLWWKQRQADEQLAPGTIDNPRPDPGKPDWATKSANQGRRIQHPPHLANFLNYINDVWFRLSIWPILLPIISIVL